MIKRIFDVVTAGLALLLLAPLFIVIAIAIKLESRGPVFYWQWRLGKGARPFRISKFRTMIDGAAGQGPAITVARDARITRVGRVLRGLDLDELPTLLNVVKGDMSVVGPRPEIVKYLEFYNAEQSAVFSVRPGVTDLGTLKFRGEAAWLGPAETAEQTYVEKILPAKLDANLEYLRRRSFWLDIVIIFRTLTLMVVHRRG